MKRILSGALVLYSLLGAIAQTDMTGKVFVFPKESLVHHVLLIPQMKKPLQNFTVCLRAYTDLTRSFSLFSYATRENHNELLLFRPRVGEYDLYIGNEKVSFKVNDDLSFPVHFCVSWESATGIAELWINDKPLVRKGLKKGYSVGAQAKIVLGQEQDSFGGSFESSQSFVGEIGEVHMWDFVLSPHQVHSLYKRETLSANILDWGALNYEIKGYVVIKPQLLS
ncbi:serum amyloid P-component-like [Trichosurus vulpecula]|uniref:serum amyloid P-component-like n=1 Tax=Trichosurus vulpecula TaxID=9337 RepID=UPI00186B33D4|nr:serum amyloid P-component-like [Trichosurus vulpecula]